MVNKIDRQKYKGIYSIPCISPINLLWPNDTIWLYRPGSALAQVMAWCVTALSHCLSQCWFIVNWTIRNKFQWNFNENNKFSIDVNASESIICEMAAILSKGRWVGNDFEHALSTQMVTYFIKYIHICTTRPPAVQYVYINIFMTIKNQTTIFVCHTLGI